MAELFVGLNDEDVVVPAATTYISSAELLADTRVTGLWKIQGYLVTTPPEVRQLQNSSTNAPGSSPAKRKAENASYAMDFILVDKTGPLLVGLKDEAAMQMHKLMKGLGDKLKGKIFDIENLKVADMKETNYNGKVLTNIRRV